MERKQTVTVTPDWTEQDWSTLDRIEQTLTTIGAVTNDDAHWLIDHLLKLVREGTLHALDRSGG